MKEIKIIIHNSKNQKIVGLLSYPDKNNLPIVIIVHGFKGTKEYYPFVNNSVECFAEAGIAVLRIDCRGSGESEGDFKEATIGSEAEDILTAIEFAKTHDKVDPKRIGIIGISMGAAAALFALRKKLSVKALIFWGPMFFGINYYDTPEHRKTIEEEGVFYVSQKFTGKKLTAGKELFNELKTLDSSPVMKLINLPTLILRGSKEEVIEISQDKKAVKLLNADYKIIKNGDHNFTDKNSETELIKSTIAWCKEKL
ncbi:MAG: alpha/beta fold hydrolase [bacterium]|nr:alpha/beta fold hydrolase [bacterium]